MTRVSGRTHAGGTVSVIMRFEEAGRTYYTPQFAPPSKVPVTGRRKTEAEAQAEADQIMAANGHVCGGGCSPWAPISN